MARTRDEETELDLYADDRDELAKLLNELHSAVTDLERESDSQDRQCNVCLLSRSVVTEFFSVCMLDHGVDERVADHLRALLGRILEKLPKGGKYYVSVSERFEDFERRCEELADRDVMDTEVPLNH